MKRLPADFLFAITTMPQRGTIHADLHTHTTASDGSLTPSALVQRAFERGVKAIAVTDHDTVAGVAEAREAAKERKMWFTSGIEVSATLLEREVHILGYAVDTSHYDLLDYARRARAYRNERAERIIARLREVGIRKLTIDNVREIAGEGVIGRQHIALAMQKKGIVRTTREAFDKYLADDAIAFTAKWEFPVKDAIALIHAAGGVAVLAHPSKVISGEQFEAMLEAGLDGVELYHPSHDTDVCRLYALLAEEHDLLTSGGSDFHGGNKRDGSNIGRYGLMQDDFAHFAKEITKRSGTRNRTAKPGLGILAQMLGFRE